MKTQKEIAEFLRITPGQFSYVLSGDRHLSYPQATLLANVLKDVPTEIDAIIWIKCGGTSAQRREAWWAYLLTIEKGD